MFKILVIIILFLLAVQNWFLRQNLKSIEQRNYQLVEQDWDRQLKKDLNLMAELQAEFDGRPNQWPVLGEISSPFGLRQDPFTGTRTPHYGIDIAVAHGSPIHAPAGGHVVFVGDGGAFGNLVVLKHQNGLKTYYGHLSNTHVQEGQRVERGDKIAEVGNTGRSTAAHLHYGVEKDGIYQDPSEYLE